MAEMTGIEDGKPLVVADRADDGDGDRVPYDSGLAVDCDVLVYRITGVFFFGAASAMGTVLDEIADQRKGMVIDFAAVPFLDSTAANVLGRVAAKAHRQRIKLFITGATPAVRRALLTHGVSPPRARYRETIARGRRYQGKLGTKRASSGWRSRKLALCASQASRFDQNCLGVTVMAHGRGRNRATPECLTGPAGREMDRRRTILGGTVHIRTLEDHRV